MALFFSWMQDDLVSDSELPHAAFVMCHGIVYATGRAIAQAAPSTFYSSTDANRSDCLDNRHCRGLRILLDLQLRFQW